MKNRKPAPPLPRRHGDGTRTWRTRDLLDQLEWLDEAVFDLSQDCRTVVLRAVKDFDDGTSTAGDVKVSGGRRADDGAENGRTPSMVLDLVDRGGDPVRRAMSTLVGEVVAIRGAMLAALGDAAFLNGLDPEVAKELVKEKKPGVAGQGFCANLHCRRWVAGTRADRLRSGRCEDCYRFRLRRGGERPRELCHPEEFPVVEGAHDGPRPEFVRDLHAVKN